MPETNQFVPAQELPWSTLGAVQSVHQHQQQIDIACGGSRLRVSVLASNLVRVRIAPSGEFQSRRSWAVAQADSNWGAVPFELDETASSITIKTAAFRLEIERESCQISCYDNDNRPFAQDRWLNVAWRTGKIACWKRIEADEHFYGLGEPTGGLDQLGTRRIQWSVDALDYTVLTDAMYTNIPVLMALRPELAYGVFLNTTFWSQFDLGSQEPRLWRMETESSELDYYIIYGPEPAQILHTYTKLTGRMPMPPRWALGYHQCRWSYDREEVVYELAEEFRARRLPCDVVHLDIDYMQGYRVFTWDEERFPYPDKLIQSLAQDGFKTVVINDPGVKYEPEQEYFVLKQGLKNNYFVTEKNGQYFHSYAWADRSLFPDFLRPEVRQWWGELQHHLTDVGVAGIWNDMNEPSIADRPFGDDGNKIAFPLDAPQGPTDERTNHAETHNLYGQMMARACREGLQRLRPQSRSFVLTRSGTAGIQRWSAVWTGDNQSLWEYLEMSLPQLCNLGLSGVSFTGADIGGFAGNATAELFARWIQIGMLYPMMRGHSMAGTEQHEPWIFGERVENICREYLELRYRLLPYLYTLFWQSATTGAPIIRPLLYHYPNDPQTYTLSDQVMLGSCLMAAPIYRPGSEHRAVYLPQGTWYDWWSGQSYQGPTHILAHAPLERMPLYAPAGSIIPLGPVMQHTSERSLDELILKVYPGTGIATLYEDDGESFEYQQGAWATTAYRVYQEDQWCVEVEARQGQWTPPQRQVQVELVGIGEQTFTDDGTARRLSFT
ncbi:MAG: glycoside hydrolase family 31 protein [Cyanophyceae cyanobacterium]